MTISLVDNSQKTRIAICGGGIAGATAAIALGRLPNVEISIFDQARELREIGASIALQPCALRCLEKMGLGDEVEKLAYRHGEHPLVHRHWKTAEVIETALPDPLPAPRHQMARFYRVHLHQLLLSHIPPGRVRLAKRVKDVKVRPQDVLVSFEDGSEWIGDAVLGADGIRSAVRQVFYPDYVISHGELITLRQVFDASLLDGIPNIPQESCHWPGPDRQLFTSPLKGNLFAIVAFLPLHVLKPSEERDNTSRQWGQKGSTADLAQYYSDWHPLIAEMAKVTPSIAVYPDYNGPALPRLDVGDGRVVLIGDAGHPHGGAFAAGGTLSIEDAYTLSLCLSHVQTSTSERLEPTAISHAFSLFNKCRHAHVNRLIDAANVLRNQRKERETSGVPWSDERILEHVKSRNQVRWLAENDAEKVFLDVIAAEKGSLSL